MFPMRRKRVIWLLAAVATLALARSAHAAVLEIGAQQPLPAASCPTSCQAVGRVSGFQVQQSSFRNPFRVNRAGKIVAFTIRLGRPNRRQRNFFTRLFGGPPSARLSILRPARTKRRHRLTGQSEVFDLAPYYGSTPTFALARPLTVQRGYVVAVTVPTWAPVLAVGLGQDQAWRSSRLGGSCDEVSQPAAQQLLGSLRSYGCLYRTARLLYSATLVPTPPTTTEPPRARRPTGTVPR
jgi:hypothetical protein